MKIKNLNKLAGLIILLVAISCNTGNDDILNTCGVDNPIEDIAWLKQIKSIFEASTQMSGTQIIQYTYKGETVFLIDACYQCPDNLVTVFNCKKEVICEFGGIAGINTCPDFESEIINKIILWKNIQP